MLAIRMFRLDNSPKYGYRILSPSIFGYPPFHNGRPAKCLRLLLGYGEQLPQHTSPSARCTCGYYAFRLPLSRLACGDFNRPFWGRDIVTLVEGYGQTIEHEMGYRFERMHIVGVFASSNRMEGYRDAVQVFSDWPWWNIANVSMINPPFSWYDTCNFGPLDDSDVLKDRSGNRRFLYSEGQTPLEAIRLLDDYIPRFPTGGASC